MCNLQVYGLKSDWIRSGCNVLESIHLDDKSRLCTYITGHNTHLHNTVANHKLLKLQAVYRVGGRGQETAFLDM